VTVLVTDSDVEGALLRPLTEDERAFIDQACERATVILRSRMRNVDARIAAYLADPTSPTGVDPAMVAIVLGDVVKRAMSNPDGAASVTTSQGMGPFSTSATRAYGRPAGAFDGMDVTDADLARLTRRGGQRPRSIQTRAALAPANIRQDVWAPRRWNEAW